MKTSSGAEHERERDRHARPQLAGAPGEVEVHAVPGGDGGEDEHAERCVVQRRHGRMRGATA